MTILLTRRKRRVVQAFLNLTVRQNVYSEAEKFFFFIATQRTLPTKKQDTILTIPLTIRYLYYLLYNTSLEYSSYASFTVFFLQLHTYVSSELSDAEQVST